MFLLVTIASVLAVSQGYSNGAGPEACTDMTPRHDVSAQTGPSPFTIMATTHNFTEGQSITVVITGTDEVEGFLLQGRDVANNDTIIGTWIDLPPKTKLMNCTNLNSVTHSEELHDNYCVTQTWMAPIGVNGTVQFYATVVRRKATFWVMQPSTLNASPQCMAAPTAMTPMVTTPTTGAAYARLYMALILLPFALAVKLMQ